MDEVQELREIDRLIIEQKLEPEDPDDLEYTEFIDDGDNESDESDEDYEIPDYQKSDISKFGTYKPVSILSENEKKLIDMCKDQDLKEMLLLNRQKNFQLIQLFKNIKDQLIECQESITEKEKLVKELKCAKRVSNKIWRIGRPYFKTVDNYYCPRNQDVVLKDKRGEILYYDMTTSHKWFKYEIKRLNAGVAFHYKMRRLDELHQTIQEKEKIMISSGQAIDSKEISELKNMIQIISNDNEVVYPPLNYNDAFEWSRIATNFLNDKFTPEDCEIFWNIYLHPNANKDLWTKEENDKLSSLVDKYKSQNWDLIAQELGNNRTAFIALMHYFRNIVIPKGGRFTPAEDKLLLDLVNVFRQGNYTPWHRVAYHFGGRTKCQLFNRYRYFLSCQEGILRGKFTIAEDILMMVLVDRFGRRFSEWKTYFPNRSHVQIKARYTSNVDKALKKGSFTLDEDKKILKHVEEYGTNKWALLVKMFIYSG
ncbi:snRNA-activating protein complex subunit 4 [Sitophilus oryzae]|uniref:snRNA-activating protein complex subunit 4 n=1 Tax=Sitophilus oryzae TaxID=7048 RepID=A0A6J2Y419_SITOR|nr:snRNA-activating protein complex subunit 4 [Sitophilus oryzae]